MIKPTLRVITMASLVITMAGCEIGGSGGNGGFDVLTQDVFTTAQGIPIGGGIPHGGVRVEGSWWSDFPGATGNVYGFDVTTHPFTADRAVPGGRRPATWLSTAYWNTICVNQVTDTEFVLVTTPSYRLVWSCLMPLPSEAEVTPKFSLAGALPGSITVTGTQFSTTYGTPYLNAYNPSGNLLAQLFASSVAPDGTSATFPYPGGPTSGLYSFNLWNRGSSGAGEHAGASFVSVGAMQTSQPAPFGVDAYDVEEEVETCEYIPGEDGEEGEEVCNTSYDSLSAAILTLPSANQVKLDQGTIAVGQQPASVKAYAPASETWVSTDHNVTETTTMTRPSRAIVTNYGDNSVSVLNLFTMNTIGFIFVGTQPIAIAMTADESKAYIANYGSGSISEINLTTLTQTRVANVGPHPAALAIDTDGTAVWVGGEGYIQKLSLATLSPVTSLPVSGAVTSLSISQQQGVVLYSTVTNTSSGSGQAPGATEQSTFSVKHMRISDQAILGSYAYSSAQGYQTAPGGSIPAPLVLANGSLVSANYGNSLAVAATPTGFVVTDVGHNIEVMRGTTPSPVRSIAVNPGQGVVYLTAPASNALITVPLPKIP